jgi:glutamyl-tRNA synthetase
MSIRVRFAPSPTGYLHIGGARTALFNWLLARKHGGTFILRIEDTDRERSTPEAIEQILASLQWLGLSWDEGPYFQTQRLDLYRQYLERLLETGAAYRCRCTVEELDRKRAEAERDKRPYRYDRTCRELGHAAEGAPFTVRFKSQPEGQLVFEDAIIGPVSKPAEDLDDLILARSDGTPTYNFCVVVDDIDMGITHVIRGLDHLNNTPRQSQIYQALGAQLPRFAHLPMIHGPDGKKLSKRREAEYREQGFAVSALEYRDMGYLSDALVNYLARLGWAHGDQEIFSRQELVEAFGLSGVGKSPAIFDAKKLRWLNQHYLKIEPADRLVGLLQPHLHRRGVDLMPGVRAGRLLAAHRERSSTLEEMADFLVPYLGEAVTLDAQAAEKLLTPAMQAPLAEIEGVLAVLEPFDQPAIERACLEVVERHKLKLGQLAQPLRVALTGRTASPGIYEVIELLGRERTLSRIQAARARIAAS